MKKLTFLFFLLPFFLNAQDYLVTFSGSAESDTVSTVFVENMTQDTSLTLSGSDVLHLKSVITGISDLKYKQTNGIQIYPNPMKEFSIIKFDMLEEGITNVELFDLSGKKLAQTQNYLNQGKHSFRITGVGRGIYILKVTTNNYSYSGKLIGDNKTGEIVNIAYQSTIPSDDNSMNTKSANSEIMMQYNEGDALKFTASSGENKSVKVEIISQSKNIDFSFYKCTDPDNRNYSTVKIGTQIWMAENLAYLPKVSPQSGESYTEPFYYVYDYNGTSVAEAKASSNYLTYGGLYNLPAAKAACPEGWHLPTHAEWTELEEYLIANGYNYDGITTGNNIAKSLATTTNWNSGSRTGAIGNNLLLNNKSGFSALPGGYRGRGTFGANGDAGYWWSSTKSDIIGTWYRFLHCNRDYLGETYNDEVLGLSVRCIRD
jgi:uncharacterized protein (TIGR02145 family)